MLTVRKEQNSPIMWRAYQVGLNRGGQLTLAGAYNGKWTDVDFTAKCNESSGAGVGAEMSIRARQSKVFLPGELNSNRKDDAVIAHRRCKLHLETGGCSCGIWGYRAPARVQREYLTTEFWTGENRYRQHQVQVLCSVRLYGTILVGEWGYRASNARIETMFVPGNIEMYALRNASTLTPAFDDHGMSFFVTRYDGYGYGNAVAQRIDPEVVWRKIADTYDAQVVHVADGVDMIQQLDKGCPDPILRPITLAPNVLDVSALEDSGTVNITSGTITMEED